MSTRWVAVALLLGTVFGFVLGTVLGTVVASRRAERVAQAILKQAPPVAHRHVGECVAMNTPEEKWEREEIARIEQVGVANYQVRFWTHSGAWSTLTWTEAFTYVDHKPQVPCP